MVRALRSAGWLVMALGLAAFAPGCGGESGDPTEADEANLTEPLFRKCIVDQPIASDGYTSFAPVDAARVTRTIMTPAGELVADPEKIVTPTAEELDRSMAAISGHIKRIATEVPEGNRRRERYSGVHRSEAPEPYCLFHTPGKPIYGTVILFHGFNDRPQQQAKLASYLFHAGFNVYNTFLANHFLVEGTEFWPKTAYNPEVAQIVAQKLENPEVRAKVEPLVARIAAEKRTELTDEEKAVVESVLAPELSLGLLEKAWTEPGGEAYRKLYNWHEPAPGASLLEVARTSDFFQFVRDAEARLHDLDALPGPVFVSGLSVGGTLALALGAKDGGRRVRGVVSHAPWLQSIDPANNTNLMFAGPLDDKIGAAGGDYPIAWPNHAIGFSPASVSANFALAAWLGMPKNVASLAAVPTAIVMTAAEDSADNAATEKLQGALTSDPRVASLHGAATYATSMNVRHAFTDPENYPEPELWNRNFRALYQESFRFYLTGKMDPQRLMGPDQDPALPKVACQTPDYPERCASLTP